MHEKKERGNGKSITYGRGQNLQRMLEEVEKFLKFKFCLDRCTLLDCVATKKGRAL